MCFNRRNIKDSFYFLKLPAIIIILAPLFSSCAIHKKFPFICFRWECVVAQLKFPELKASIRLNKAIASSKRKKRNRAKSVSSGIKEVNKPNINQTEKQSDPNANTRKDSVFTFSAPVMVTKTETQDTLIVFEYKLNEENISDENKNELKNYIVKVGAGKISQIKINGFSDAEEDSHHKGMGTTRAKKIYKLFAKLGIPSSKITIGEVSDEEQKINKRSIEIRVR